MCSIESELRGFIVVKDNLFSETFDKTYNTKIPNIFRKCYSENVNLVFPDICPLIFSENNNISTYEFRTPLIIDSDLMKAIFYYGIETPNTKYVNNVQEEKERNLEFIDNSLKLLKINDNIESFRIYLFNKYTKDSLFYQYLVLIGIIYKNYRYNLENKVSCSYKINWDYTYGCTIEGEILKNVSDFWNYNDLLILNVFLQKLLNEGLDLTIKSTNLNEFMKIIQSFLIVLKDNYTEFIYKTNKLCYCAPSYYFLKEDVVDVYNTYVVNSTKENIDTLNSRYKILNFYGYEINITNVNDITSQLNLDSNTTLMHNYFFKRDSNNQIDNNIENISDIKKFPLFYYDNNIIPTDIHLKYLYNENLSLKYLNGLVQIYDKNRDFYNENLVVQDFYFTSIAVIIDKKKIGLTNEGTDILNETAFGKGLRNNFQLYYEAGLIQVSSLSTINNLILSEDNINFENNVILLFFIKQNYNFYIDTLSNNILAKNSYNIDFNQTNSLLNLAVKENIKIENNIFNKNPFINYRIQRFTGINEINYGFNMGFFINFVLEVKPISSSTIIPQAINIEYYNPFSNSIITINNIPFNPPDVNYNSYYIQLNSNQYFPWCQILITIISIPSP